MKRTVTLILDREDVGQILDGLIVRLEAWEKTSDYLKGGQLEDGFAVEECTDAIEADAIADRYSTIIETIRSQIDGYQ